ncbi:MAG: DUF779 domain-containing protein [Bacteroidetes bacterium]|nr:DUF779 domain-containing protein [Bacteroidota bacterium]
MTTVKRILVTPAASELITLLRVGFGDLVFHQSGGCCDGSSPMCFQKDEFKIGNSDVGLGYVGGFEFWMSKDQFEYWQHTELTLDVVNGRGASFSLEIPTSKRFLIRSRIYTEEEMNHLEPLFYKKD